MQECTAVYIHVMPYGRKRLNCERSLFVFSAASTGAFAEIRRVRRGAALAALLLAAPMREKAADINGGWKLNYIRSRAF